jgi:hypothetical protein
MYKMHADWKIIIKIIIFHDHYEKMHFSHGSYDDKIDNFSQRVQTAVSNNFPLCTLGIYIIVKNILVYDKGGMCIISSCG